MKSYSKLAAAALGLFLMVGSLFADMSCPSCKAAIPSGTKPVVALLAMDAKCSMCGADLKAGMNAGSMMCPACKAEITVCDTCMKTMEPAE